MAILTEKAMPEHQVTGEITVQCIEGSIEFTAAETNQLMHAGDLICLAGGTVHALKAVKDSSEPQYEIQNDKSNHIAIHKESALHRANN